MSPSRSWLKRARCTLASHVDRLQETLVVLTERVRETVAQAVSTNLASAIREAVHALFSDSEPSRAPPSYYPSSPYRPPSTWGDSERYDREDDDDLQREDWSTNQSRGWRDVQCDPGEPMTSTGEQPDRVRWHSALALGCQAAAWWLRRQVNRASALAALGIGLLASGAALIAGFGLADSALHLMSLADAVRSGRHALSALP
jgi:hypothetical protein